MPKLSRCFISTEIYTDKEPEKKKHRPAKNIDLHARKLMMGIQHTNISRKKSRGISPQKNTITIKY
ncbi:MAG: hypothetical protein WC460_00585 [Patescibacteria group bacterium]